MYVYMYIYIYTLTYDYIELYRYIEGSRHKIPKIQENAKISDWEKMHVPVYFLIQKNKNMLSNSQRVPI